MVKCVRTYIGVNVVRLLDSESRMNELFLNMWLLVSGKDFRFKKVPNEFTLHTTLTIDLKQAS